jgi:hypothetical protein
MPLAVMQPTAVHTSSQITSLRSYSAHDTSTSTHRALQLFGSSRPVLIAITLQSTDIHGSTWWSANGLCTCHSCPACTSIFLAASTVSSLRQHKSFLKLNGTAFSQSDWRTRSKCLDAKILYCIVILYVNTVFTWMQDDSNLPQIKHICQGPRYLSKSKPTPQK